MRLVLASHAAISALGSTAANTIEPLLSDYRDAVGAELLMLDVSESMEEAGLDALPAITADATRGVINHLRRAKADVDDVLLIGGDAIFPFFTFANPVTDRSLDPDASVSTDNPYGVLDSATPDWLRPTIPIARIWDGGDARVLAHTLELLLANHVSPPARFGGSAIYNVEWDDASQVVAAALSGALGVNVDVGASPPYQVANPSDLDRRIIYANLHGFDGDAAWKSYDMTWGRFLDVVTPAAFDEAHVAGVFVASEACYGAQVSGRTVRNSCALSAHAAGATVLGATGLVWGTARDWAYVDDGDAFAACVFKAAPAGMETPVGDAIIAGRNAFLRRDQLNAFQKKTALQFILLGDPSLAL